MFIEVEVGDEPCLAVMTNYYPAEPREEFYPGCPATVDFELYDLDGMNRAYDLEAIMSHREECLIEMALVRGYEEERDDAKQRYWEDRRYEAECI